MLVASLHVLAFWSCVVIVIFWIMVNELTATDQRVKKIYNREYNTQSCWQGKKQAKSKVKKWDGSDSDYWQEFLNEWKEHHWTAIDNFIPLSAEMDPSINTEPCTLKGTKKARTILDLLINFSLLYYLG